MKNCLYLVILCAAPLTIAYGADPETKTFSAAGLNGISALTEAGAVSLEGGAKGEIRVEITNNEPDKCVLTMKAEGERLVLRAETGPAVGSAAKQGFFKSVFSLFSGLRNASGCRAGFKIYAPASLQLKANAGSGAIKVSAMSGDVTAENGSGGISLENLTGSVSAENGSGGISGSACAKSLRVRTGSGGIDLSGLCGEASAKAGSGSIVLRWEQAPVSGEARAEAGSGSVTLLFPERTDIKTSLHCGSGRVTNEFPGGGKFPVSVETGSGSISILKAK